MSSFQSKLVLVDCNYLCHRARYTTGGLTYKDQPTGVIFGFLNQLLKLGQDLKPDNIVFTWDSRESVRKQAYSFYKEKRKNNDADPREIEDTYKQFNMLRDEILPGLGFVNNFIQEGYEADDIMARISHSKDCILATSDDDMLQVLSDEVSIYNLGKQIHYTKQRLFEEKRITPEQWIEVKKIAGCSSDNVPGIPGVGEKTAIAYLVGKLNSESKKYKDIVNQYDEIAQRNEWLVKLPLSGTERFHIRKNNFEINQLSRVCNQYGFNKMKYAFDDWKVYFG